MATHNVTIIPGDGVGPELYKAVRRVLEATEVRFQWDVQTAGQEVYEETGDPMPDRVFESIRKNKVGLKSPITTPVGTGFRSVNVLLRKTLDLYACVRPVKTYPGAPTPFENVDIVTVRENTEDLYAGVEFEKGADDTAELIDWLHEHGGEEIREDSGISIKPNSVYGSERIVRYAFEYAKRYDRDKVTAVHKANIMKYSDGLFLDVAREVAEDYPGIEFDDKIVDALSMLLVSRPQEFDVLVAPNLYGDIVSDLCAGLVGGLGLAPGGNIGDEYAVFEATHGSAPHYAGKDVVNPMALILSGVNMLRYLDEDEAANDLEAAVAKVIADGEHITYDLRADRDKSKATGTQACADAIIDALEDIRGGKVDASEFKEIAGG